jgi:basic membrane protein A
MNVGYVYPYPISQDELAQSLEQGRLVADEELSFIQSTVLDARELDAAATDAATELVQKGSTVIVAASSYHADAFAAFADANPDVQVLSFQSPTSGDNLTSFDGRMYQAYYLAGFAAARSAPASPRLGILGSVVTPPIVARINAFALGARRALEGTGTQATIEVRWIGEWHDTGEPVSGELKERRETRALLEAGAQVVAHTLDSNIPLVALPELNAQVGVTAYAVAANLQAGCDGPAANLCVGSAYYNFGPLLSRALFDLQRGQGGNTVLMGIANGGAQSAVGFQRGNAAPSSLDGELDVIRAELAVEGVGPIFDGEITSGQCSAQTGDSPCVPMDARLDDQGLARMCWFIDDVGLVERPDGMTDMAAIVPQACVDGLPD